MIEAKSTREWVVRFADGEELAGRLKSLASPSALILTGIGMLRDTEVGYWNGTQYETHAIPEPAELISLQGNLAMDSSGQRIAHVHVALARRDGTVVGGHLIRATVHNTLEMGLLPLDAVVLERRLESNGLVGLFPRTT